MHLDEIILVPLILILAFSLVVPIGNQSENLASVSPTPITTPFLPTPTGPTPTGPTPTGPTPTPIGGITPTRTPTPIVPPTTTPTPIACPPSTQPYNLAINVGHIYTPSETATHPDLNLQIRGYEPYPSGEKRLISYSGATDLQKPPQLGTILNKGSDINSTYQVYDWNWSTNSRGSLLTSPYPVTLIGLASSPLDPIQVPESNHMMSSFQAVVIYADQNSITFHYTPADNPTGGYTVHIADICVDQNLVNFYQQKNNAGRGELPALLKNQVFGVARTTEVKVAIRDSGQFMDPRSKKDWWQGY